MIAEALSAMLPARASRAPTDDFWYTTVGDLQPTPSGVTVSSESALRVGTVFACVRLLSEVIGSLPCILYRRLPTEGKERATTHPVYRVLHDRPNDWQTPQEFFEMLVAHVNLRGNFYGLIEERLGAITGITPLHPDRMEVERLKSGALIYHWRDTDGQTYTYPQSRMFHVRGLCIDDSGTGVSTISYARNTIGSAIAMQEHGGAFFRNGGIPPIWIKRPAGRQWNDTARHNFRAGWRAMHGGSRNAHNPPILEDDMELHSIPISNEDSQWLESSNATAEDICRFFRVQPHLVGLLARATFSNIEQQGLDTVRYTLAPWLNRIAQAARRDLLAEDETDLFAEFLADALLKGDTATRFAAYNVAIQGGWMMRNEARERENWNRLPGLDEPLEPLNMAPAGSRTSDTEQEEDDETQDDDEPVARSIAPLVRDAAERIVSSECSHLEKVEPDGRWRLWLEARYVRHHAYVAKTLAPLAEFTAATVDVEALARAICAASVAALELQTAGTLASIVDDWKRHKAESLTQQLLEQFQ